MGPGFESLKVHQKFVIQTCRNHLFPFRTQKLSCRVPTILGWRRPGKIGHGGHRVGTDVPTQKFVLQACRNHLFPFRTQKLSCRALKILGWRRPGKIGQSEHSSLAQLAERMTVNHDVAGSSPAGGARTIAWKGTKYENPWNIKGFRCFRGNFQKIILGHKIE